MSEPSRQEMRANHAENAIYSFNPITITDTKEIFIYNSETGLYESGERTLERFIQDCFSDTTTTTDIKETLAIIQRKTYIDRKTIDEKNKNLIPLKNCILKLPEKEILSYSKEKIFFTKHAITYKPEEKECLHIQKFLEEITEKEIDIQLLKEMIGYCFVKNYKFQAIFALVGEGANGKSVLLNLTIEMLGTENVCQKTLQLLTDYIFSAAALYGKSANIINDLPKKQFKETGMLKALSGGDWIEAEIKHKGSIKFKNYAKLIAACNEMPQSDDDTTGFYRRFVIINFPHRFEGQADNKNLLQELTSEEEKSAFFNACIDAYLIAETKGDLSYAASMEEKRKNYLNYSNSAKVFAEECLELDSEGSIEKIFLWAEYLDFCKKNKIVKKSMVWFFRELYKFYAGNVRQSRATGIMKVQGISFKKNDIFEASEEQTGYA
jgi:putative DNA primase/helicase